MAQGSTNENPEFELRQPPNNRHEPNEMETRQRCTTDSSIQNSLPEAPSLVHQLVPLFLLILIFIAAIAGDLLIRLDTNSTSISRGFADTNQFNEWSFIVAGVLGVCVAVAASTWPPFLRVARTASPVSVIVAVSIYLLISAAVILIPFIIDHSSVSFELSHFYLRMSILTILILIAGGGSFCGLELLWYTQSNQIDAAVNFPPKTVESILSARRNLQRFFAGATVLITSGVVIIGGLRSALNAHVTYNSAAIPVAALLLYGAFFAMLLAFVLIPAYTAWQQRIAKFRDYLYPVPEKGDFSKDWYEARSNLEDLLAMRAGLPGRFLAAVGILAPLIGSIISAIIPTLR